MNSLLQFITSLSGKTIKRILFLILFSGSTLFAQIPVFEVVEGENQDTAFLEDTRQKSVEAAWWSAYARGSDYWVYFTWGELYNSCPCSKNCYLQVWEKGVLVLQTGWLGNLHSYSGDAYKHGLGPSQQGQYTWKLPYTGKTYLISPSFDCWYNCSGYWQAGGTHYASTSAIKPPKNVAASDKVSDSYITVSWGAQTDIPNAQHGYIIYRDGDEVKRVYNGVFTWTDNNVLPATEYTYIVKTYTNDWGGKVSSGVSAVGRTFDLGLAATSDLKDRVRLTWTNATSIGAQKYKIERFDGEITDVLNDNIDKGTTTYSDYDGIPGYVYTYIITPLADGKTFFPDDADGKKLPNGKFSGEVKAPFGGGVADVQICAVRLDSIPGDTTSRYCDSTDATGYFEIEQIYYYDEAAFRLLPKKGEHGFSPAYLDRTLQLGASSIGNLNFTDTSSFTVSGQIIQHANMGDCYVKNVEILVDNLYKGTKTDQEGKFVLTVPETGTYTFKARMENHYFSPSVHSYFIDSDSVKVNFEDTTRFFLDGYVLASCNIYIGQADLRIYSKDLPASCFDTTITTELETGYYNIELPARSYNLELVKFYPLDENIVTAEDVETYFNTQIVDLTFGDVTKDFTYRKPPTMTVIGFDEYGCDPYDVPIVEQAVQYNLLFEVRESFGESTCLADTGYVVIYDGLADESNKVDTLYLEGGKATYMLTPGAPNIIAPYLKHFEAVAYVEGEEDMFSQDVLVVGNRPREKTFTTVSPEIPFMILRDPPGDASYSYLSSGTTTQTALRFSAKQSFSANIWGEVKVGAKFETGFIVSTEFEVWGKVKGSLEIGASIGAQNEFSLSITNSEEFTTSGNPDITGEEGDIFAGSALNIIYALTDVITYNPATCGVDKTVELIIGTDGFVTTFIYTEDHIRNVLIPQLTQIRNIYLAQGSDSAALYTNQINVWLQTLKLNEDLKQKAEFIENRSVSAGSKYEAFKEVSTTKSIALEFSLYIEMGVAIEAGIDVGGSGISGGVETKFRTEFGASASLAQTITRKTGFVLDDDDQGDYFSVDILADEVYGTPVFKLVSGRTSCPWEPGTQPREGVQLISDTYNEFVDDPNGEAVFKLQLGNTSQSDEPRDYNLVFFQASNPDGAILTLGGSPVQGGILTPYTIPVEEPIPATVTVKRGPEAFDYNNLQFALVSGCGDGAIADTVSLYVHFSSPCSNISMTRPLQNWILSTPDNNKLKVRLEGYDPALLSLIKLQYSDAGKNNWITHMTVEKSELGVDKTDVVWVFEGIQEGLYDLRAVVECNEGKVYSDILTGLIDRMPPELFGLPEPADLVLDKGDKIMASFNEDLNCYKVTKAQVLFTNLTTNEQVDFSVGCNGNSIIIVPDFSGLTFEDDTFNVTVAGIEDQYGNVITESIGWSFLVPGPENVVINEDEDSDNDGLINKDDNCPYSANAGQEDMDSDNIGDICDEDLDGDGILNLYDNCLLINNPGQEDSDGDGIGDLCQYPAGVKPVAGQQYMFDAYPNPFADYTTIKYSVPVESYVVIRIFDILGNQVTSLVGTEMLPGNYELIWDSKEYSDGIYFFSIFARSVSTNDQFWQTKIMMLTR